MIQEAYVSFETAKLLKEKGFDVPTKTYYTFNYHTFYDEERARDWNNLSEFKYISAPTHQMVLAWLRKNRAYIVIRPHIVSVEHNATIYSDNGYLIELPEDFNTYEEATEEAIKYSLENLI